MANKNLYEFEGETYEWEETEDGELKILTSRKEAAKSIMKELAENGELEHGDYLARDVIEMAENMDGLRWVVFKHGSDCRCAVMTRVVARPFTTKKEAIKAAEEDLKQGYKIYRHEGQWIAEGVLA